MERRVHGGRADKEAAVLSFRAQQRGRHLRTPWKPASPPHPAWLKLRCQQENLQLRRYSDPCLRCRVVSPCLSQMKLPQTRGAGGHGGRGTDGVCISGKSTAQPGRNWRLGEAQRPVPRADPELLQANGLLRGFSLALD